MQVEVLKKKKKVANCFPINMPAKKLLLAYYIFMKKTLLFFPFFRRFALKK